MARAEIMGLAHAAFQIMFEQLCLVGRGGIKSIGKGHGISIAVWLADQAFIDAREFLRLGIDGGAAHFRAARRHRPAFERNAS